MKRRGTAVLLIAAMLLGGCSAYYQKEPETTKAPEPTSRENETPEIGGARPGAGAPDPDDGTVAALELPERTDTAMNPEIVIASDIHYLAKELTDFGEAFESMAEHGDGKVVPYVWEITDAFLDSVVERRPQVLLLSGDLALQGERSSQEALAQKLARVERAGVDVLVIPGNHDINNPQAASFRGAETMPAERTSPEEFAQIYADYGYSEALSRDPASLSYIYQLDDGTWLLMLDSCQYEDGYHIGGMIRTETYQWLEEWMDSEWEEGRNVIVAAHHNLLDESRIYESDCTIEHGEEMEKFMDEWGITLFLSGHLHVQHYRASDLYDVQEIVTGCLAMAPCQYGVLKYFGPKRYDYHTERVDVKAWAERHDDPDANLREFDDYAAEFLRAVFYDQAYDSLKGKDLPPEDVDEMAEFYAYINAYSVAGRAVEVVDRARDSWEYRTWQEFNRSEIRSMYLDEIFEDAVCDYNTFQRNDE